MNRLQNLCDRCGEIFASFGCPLTQGKLVQSTHLKSPNLSPAPPSLVKNMTFVREPYFSRTLFTIANHGALLIRIHLFRHKAGKKNGQIQLMSYINKLNESLATHQSVKVLVTL